MMKKLLFFINTKEQQYQKHKNVENMMTQIPMRKMMQAKDLKLRTFHHYQSETRKKCLQQSILLLKRHMKNIRHPMMQIWKYCKTLNSRLMKGTVYYFVLEKKKYYFFS
jgi:hypothetical protein